MKVRCSLCEGTGKLGFQREDCCSCFGEGFIDVKYENNCSKCCTFCLKGYKTCKDSCYTTKDLCNKCKMYELWSNKRK